MTSRLSKELRLLLPAWLLSIAGMGLPILKMGYPAGFNNGVSLLTIGCACLGACPFGLEFSHKTFPQLLAQPIERKVIWAEKMRILGILILPLIVILFLHRYLQGNIIGASYFFCFIPLCAFCSGPYLTLISGSALGGIVFSLAIPLLISIAVGNISKWIPQIKQYPLLAITLGVYCIATYTLGYWKFKSFQIINALWESEIQMPSVIDQALPSIRSLLKPRTSVLWNLLVKEFHLHGPSYLMAASFSAIALISLLGREYDIALDASDILLALILPVTLGSVVFASERKIGIHIWQLSLPVSLRRQWCVKIAVCLSLHVLLCVLLPLTLSAILRHPQKYRNLGWMLTSWHDQWEWLLLLTSHVLFAMYASSLSKSALQASLRTVGMLACYYLYMMMILESRMIWFVNPIYFDRGLRIHSFIVMGFLLLFTFYNYRREETPRNIVVKQILITAMMGFVLTHIFAGMFIYTQRGSNLGFCSPPYVKGG